MRYLYIYTTTAGDGPSSCCFNPLSILSIGRENETLYGTCAAYHGLWTCSTQQAGLSCLCLCASPSITLSQTLTFCFCIFCCFLFRHVRDSFALHRHFQSLSLTLSAHDDNTYTLAWTLHTARIFTLNALFLAFLFIIVHFYTLFEHALFTLYFSFLSSHF